MATRVRDALQRAGLNRPLTIPVDTLSMGSSTEPVWPAILVAKAALRLHLKVPGHSMFFTMFFLLIARGCVQHRLAGTFT